MRKLQKIIWTGILLLPTVILHAAPAAAAAGAGSGGGLDEGIEMVASTGTLFGTIIVVVAVSLWMLPIAFAGLVYTGQKKKAEQMHEEVGLKAAILALLSGVLGAAMAYYIVGTIGSYAEQGKAITKVDLESGNKYLLKAVIGSGVEKINP